MIILIGGTKGGSGKSTVTTNLAAHWAGEEHDVFIMDTDVKQASSAKWVERRENPKLNPTPLPKIHCDQISGNVYNAALNMAKLHEIVLVDAGGNDSRELRTAMVAADLFYIPLQASQFDLETLETLNDMIISAMDQNPTLKVYGLLSRAPSGPSSEVLEARELLAEFPLLGLCDSVIENRKIYRDALPLGRGAVEGRNSTARAEIQLLAEEILKNDQRS